MLIVWSCRLKSSSPSFDCFSPTLSGAISFPWLSIASRVLDFIFSYVLNSKSFDLAPPSLLKGVAYSYAPPEEWFSYAFD
jgi:hypothetical protein